MRWFRTLWRWLWSPLPPRNQIRLYRPGVEDTYPLPRHAKISQGEDYTPPKATWQASTLALVNSLRRVEDLPLLRLDPTLCREAERRAREYTTRGVTFFRPEQELCDRLTTSGYHALEAGETVAADFNTGESAVLAWWWSGPHRRVLCSVLLDAGLATAVSESGRVVWVFLLANRARRRTSGAVLQRSRQERLFPGPLIASQE